MWLSRSRHGSLAVRRVQSNARRWIHAVNGCSALAACHGALTSLARISRTSLEISKRQWWTASRSEDRSAAGRQFFLFRGQNEGKADAGCQDGCLHGSSSHLGTDAYGIKLANEHSLMVRSISQRSGLGLSRAVQHVCL
jgi:hypothetical protein